MAAPRFLALGELSALARLFEFRSVSRWVGLGLLVGVISGLAAGLLFSAIAVVQHVFLHLLGNYDPLGPRGEVVLFQFEPVGGPHRWVLVVAPAVGALAASMLVARFGGGLATPRETDQVIGAFHSGSHPRALSRVVRGLASALVVGTGGSAGREGPVALMGAALSTGIGRLFGLTQRERRLMLLAGAAGGIGAIFQSPLGAALFVLEVLYRDDFEADAMVPTVIASVVGYSVFTMIFGRGAILQTAGDYAFHPLQLPFYLVMAAVVALVGHLFVQVMTRVQRDVFQRLPLPPVLVPAVGGLGVGLLSLVVPQALGAGYGWLQEALLPTGADERGWMAALSLLGIALAKVVTTSLSIGSGAPGGVFGPSVVIGGMVGGACGLAFHELAPAVVTQPGAFVLVGMASFVGGAAKAPISTLVMASEMTGSYELLVPLMLAEVVTFAMSRNFSLYTTQVNTRRDSPAHAAEYVFDVLDEVHVDDVYDREAAVLPVAPTVPVAEILRQASEGAHQVFPVVSGGEVRGIVTLETLRAAFADADLQQFAIAEDCAAPFVSLSPDESLRVALERFSASNCPVLPVVEAGNPNEIKGLLSYTALLDAYADEVMRRQGTGTDDDAGERETVA